MTQGEAAHTEQGKEEYIKEIVWRQLSQPAREEIDGSWKNGTVEKITLQNQAFPNSEKYIGKELYRVSFDSKKDAGLGPVTVFVDQQTENIVGYGYRD